MQQPWVGCEGMQAAAKQHSFRAGAAASSPDCRVHPNIQFPTLAQMLLVQVAPATQSAPTLQPEPTAQSAPWARQSGPPQSVPVSWPFFLPSVQVGCGEWGREAKEPVPLRWSRISSCLWQVRQERAGWDSQGWVGKAGQEYAGREGARWAGRAGWVGAAGWKGSTGTQTNRANRVEGRTTKKVGGQQTHARQQQTDPTHGGQAYQGGLGNGGNQLGRR